MQLFWRPAIKIPLPLLSYQLCIFPIPHFSHLCSCNTNNSCPIDNHHCTRIAHYYPHCSCRGILNMMSLYVVRSLYFPSQRQFHGRHLWNRAKNKRPQALPKSVTRSPGLICPNRLTRGTLGSTHLTWPPGDASNLTCQRGLICCSMA